MLNFYMFFYIYNVYVGFHVGKMQLPCEGLDAKLAREAMRDILFASWLEHNP